MKKERKPEQFIRQPGYPGGQQALKEFIRQNLRYPEEALKNKIEGTVSVEYELDQKGNVIDAKVKKGIGHGCDEEALRVTRLLKFSSAKVRGYRVTFHKTINIHFKLPGAPLPQKSAQIVYTFVEKKKEEKETYGYSIRFNN